MMFRSLLGDPDKPLEGLAISRKSALRVRHDKPEPPGEPFALLLQCPTCGTEMRLLGIESENPARDLYTFECAKCGRLGPWREHGLGFRAALVGGLFRFPANFCTSLIGTWRTSQAVLWMSACQRPGPDARSPMFADCFLPI